MAGTWEARADLEKLAVAYREGGRKIRARAARRLRDTAEPLVHEVVAKGAEKMPHGGGLSARLAGARSGVTVALLGQRVSVSLRVKTAEGYDLKSLNKGILRHPIFPEAGQDREEWLWSKQSVPANAYTDAFEEGAPVVRTATAMAVREALAEIAREASSP